MPRPQPQPGLSITRLQSAIDAIREEVAGVIRLTLLIAGIGSLMMIGFIWLRSQLYVLVLPTRSEGTLAGLATLIVVWVTLMVCMQHIRDWSLVNIAGRVARRLAVPACITAAEAGGHPDQRTSQALEDINEVNRCLTGPAVAMLIEAALVPLFLAALFFVHWSYAITAMVACGLAATISLSTDHALRSVLEQGNELRARTTSAIADAVNTAEMVQAHGMLPALTRSWSAGLHDAEQSLLRAQRLSRLAHSLNLLLSWYVRGVVLVQSILLSFNGLELGFAIISTVMMTYWVMRPFSHVGSLFAELAEGRAAWRRLQDLARQQPPRGAASGFSVPHGRLVVEQLTVMLPGMSRPLLREVSLAVGPGEVVGIAGPVGSGKSTLLRAIMGIQRPTAGGCYLDGHVTWQWDRVDIARHVGFLPQDPGLTDGTVAEAIARLDMPDMALVIEAATRAGAHEAIVRLPQGYATPLSEQMLSAGQRQRIALARAIYGRPRLVVLDEPSAWLDEDGVRQLIRLFAILKADGCGVLFSSHSLELVEAADQVLAMRGGMLGARRSAEGKPRLPRPVAAEAGR